MAQIEITYAIPHHDGFYRVVMEAPNVRAFSLAAQNPKVADKKGEELVAAILADCRESSGPGGYGYITGIARFYNNKEHNGPDDQDACEAFDPKTGKLAKAISYRDGDWANKLNGGPASRVYDEEGRIISASSVVTKGKIKDLTKEELDTLNAAPQIEKRLGKSGVKVLRP